MLRRGIWLFGFVVALLGSVAARPSAQASTITLISAGPSHAKPGLPFDFDWMLHPTIGINQDNASFAAHFRDGSLVQRAEPIPTLADAESLATGHGAAPSSISRVAQIHVLPLPSSGLFMLTALVPLVGLSATIARRPSSRE